MCEPQKKHGTPRSWPASKLNPKPNHNPDLYDCVVGLKLCSRAHVATSYLVIYSLVSIFTLWMVNPLGTRGEEMSGRERAHLHARVRGADNGASLRYIGYSQTSSLWIPRHHWTPVSHMLVYQVVTENARHRCLCSYIPVYLIFDTTLPSSPEQTRYVHTW